MTGNAYLPTYVAGELLAMYGDDVEEGIELYCVSHAWRTASLSSPLLSRPDLMDTLVLPTLEDAAKELIQDCITRTAAVSDVVARLAACRALRERMTLSELLGAAEAARLIGRIRGAQADADAAIPLQDGEGLPFDDGASEWSDASSVVSGFNNNFDSHSYASGSSAGSARSGASKSSGKFSHFSQSALPTTLTNIRSSLRMNESELTPLQIAATDTHLAGKIVDKWEARKEGGRGQARTDRSRRKAASKALRVRPGSKGEERGEEEELARLLPIVGSTWVLQAQGIVSDLVFFGRAAAAAAIVKNYNAFLDAIKASPLPSPRRDVKRELRAIAGDASMRDEDLVDSVVLPLLTYPCEDPVDALRDPSVRLAVLHTSFIR
jgi:hypothetical protein